MNVKLISSTQGQGEFERKSVEEMIVYAARVSSSRKDKFDNPAGLLKYCIDNKHWSIFEHGTITMEIVTSKAIGIQLLRHRSFTFQEFSQRYAKVTEIEPIEIRRQAIKNRQSSEEVFNPSINVTEGINFKATEIVDNLLNHSLNVYNKLIEAGVAKECARMVLPMATQTTIYMTGTIRSWLSFLNIRLDNHAQKEIVELSIEIAKLIAVECPTITKSCNNFNDFKGMFM